MSDFVLYGSGLDSSMARSLASLDIFKADLSSLSRFGDSETRIQIRPEDPSFSFKDCSRVFIIASISDPVDKNLMEVLLALDALKRRTSACLIVIATYLGYSRQDRIINRHIEFKDNVFEVAEPISSRLIINILETAGADELIVIDPHVAQIEGFGSKVKIRALGFEVLSNLLKDVLVEIFLGDISQASLENFVLVAPDLGAAKRVRIASKLLCQDLGLPEGGVSVAYTEKLRLSPGVSQVLGVIGNIQDKICLILDDIIDSGGTLCNAANELLNTGASKVYAFATHGVLSGKAKENILLSRLSTVFLTNTITPPPWSSDCKGRIKWFCISDILSAIIKL